MERLNMIMFYCCAMFSILITDSTSAATDTIFSNQTLKDGDTIVSAGEIFELGFFSNENSSLRYLGIWYKKISTGTVVWVANRAVPLVDFLSMLKLNSNTIVWSSLSSKLATHSNPVAQLLDSGNLVIRNDIGSDLIWQSFDSPGNNWLPGMKICVDLVTGINWNLTSWKTNNDPSLGSYTVWMNINGYPQLYNMKYESSFKQRIGYWNGLGFTGMFVLLSSNSHTYEFVLNDEEIYIRFTKKNDTHFTRMILDPEGNFFSPIWIDSSQEWLIFRSPSRGECDRYGLCGPYGICSIDKSPPCACLEGFEPKLPDEWSIAEWSNGCKRQTYMAPEKGHNFMKFPNLKLPDSQNSWFNTSISLEECENICANNVSCIAFANTDIRGSKSGCLTWYSDLIDIRESQGDVAAQDFYIKMANP